MKILSFKYTEYEGNPREWVMSEANFDTINLIVGKNASGKSRALNVISGLADLLSGRRQLFQSGSYRLTLESEGNKKKYHYELDLKDGKIHHELFKVSKQAVLQVDSKGIGTIYAEQIKQYLKMQSPLNQLAAVAKRDKIQHPSLEILFEWAMSVKIYRFGTMLGKDTIFLMQSGAMAADDFASDASRVVELYQLGLEKHGEIFQERILKDFNSIGYDCESVGLKTNENLHIKGIPAAIIFVKERELKTDTDQISMSSGMFRALSLIIQMHFGIMSNKHTCILIDDIGEGLDFERSTKLIKLLISMIDESSMQLLMTSNDRFVMNNIPLEYWSVIRRENQKISIINYKNSEKIFKEFEYIGMSNFDFFASEFFKGEKND